MDLWDMVRRCCRHFNVNVRAGSVDVSVDMDRVPELEAWLAEKGVTSYERPLLRDTGYVTLRLRDLVN